MRPESPRGPMGRRRPSRRATASLYSRPMAALAAAAAVAVTAAGCGSGDDGDVELRFSWWGHDERHAVTQEVIDLFEEKNPGITVEGEPTDWDSYWDRLATSSSAQDAPDIIQHDEQYLRDYAGREALLDLDEVSDQLDVSEVDELVVDTGELEGGRYAVPTGVNAFVIVADPQAFDEAGVEMPDDTTWTWDDYVDTAIEISEESGGDIVGAQNNSFNTAGFEIFARQNGESLYTEDGGLGFSAETMERWWEYTVQLQDGGGEPGPGDSIERDADGPDRSVLATNDGAMAGFWTNQVGDLTAAADRELEILRFPGETEFEQAGTFYKPAMHWTVSADTEHPEEAAMFVDFLVNDTEAGELMQADRGLPANTTVREEISGDLPDADVKSAEFLADIEDDVRPSDPSPPQGAGEVVDIVKRINEDILHGDTTPDDAASRFIEESEAAIE
ncbi:multiple sugar transport system substrate-binding protein [Lipingzhangella halophila]|uniref:Multiple sugar transport system substrate-binding protein n=1 Tax=Lipingzhangella halophila TaxID=1783352 RepID=A0A7W7RHN7_9ACTN|nr:extracellular solute-binding protein [Lipingzhangella halophila]MBB4932163.1 multiple sugar transport system substrate-binding protein [Lipingzhangella halophila]